MYNQFCFILELNILSLKILIIGIIIVLLLIISIGYLIGRHRKNAAYTNREKRKIEKIFHPIICDYVYANTDKEDELRIIEKNYKKYCKTKLDKELFLKLIMGMMQFLRGEISEKFFEIYKTLNLGKNIKSRLNNSNKEIVLDAIHEINVFQLSKYQTELEVLFDSPNKEIQYESIQSLFKLKGEEALSNLYQFNGELSEWQQIQLVQTIKDCLLQTKPDISFLYNSKNISFNRLADKLLKVYPQFQVESN